MMIRICLAWEDHRPNSSVVDLEFVLKWDAGGDGGWVYGGHIYLVLLTLNVEFSSTGKTINTEGAPSSEGEFGSVLNDT
jgi:hypothetical protein